MLGEDFIPSSGVSKFDSKLSKTNIESLKLSIPGLNKPDALQRKKNLEINIVETKENTKKLIDSMVEAHLQDHNAIKTKNGPAIFRIMLLKEVE